MTLYQKVSWTIGVEDYLKSWKHSRLAPKLLEAVPDNKQTQCHAASNVAACYYLMGDKQKAREFAVQSVGAVLEFYYGSWKSDVPTDSGLIDTDWWRHQMAWIDTFVIGLCWASALGEWTSVEKIAEYPSSESQAAVGFTKEDKSAYLAVSRLLQNQSIRECSSAVIKGSKIKPKLIVEALNAIAKSDEIGFERAMIRYLTHYRRHEFKRTSLSTLLCFDGTILLNIGAKQGLHCCIPSEITEHIISFDPPVNGRTELG